MAKLNDIFPSNYLKAADLQGRQITVTIARVDLEMLGNDRKLVAYFKGKEKGVVLNKTNANTIAAVYGDDTDEWTGGELVLFPAMVDFQGKSVEAIRVKVPPRRPAASPRADSDYRGRDRGDRASERITSGPQPSTAEILDDEIPF